MTVPSTKNVKTHVGNGVTTVFPFDFRIFEAEDLEVSLTLADGTIEEWVLGTDFTVPAKWEDVQAGGEIIATTAPASGTTLVIKRVLDLLQQTDLRNQGDFLAEVIEDQFDRFAMQDQQLNEVQGRTLQRPLSGGGWNALGYPIKNLGASVDPNDAVRKSELSAFATGVIQPLVDEAEDYRDQAGISADQAANSATTASNAATTATNKLTEFQGQYYGALASDPTEDPNGNPPDEGDLYWNTTAKQWRVWNGTAWQQPDTAVPVNYDRRDYIATAGQTVFEVAYDAPFVQVWVNGLLLPPSDYEASTGTNVVLDEGVVAGTEVSIVGLGAVAIGVLDGDNAVVTTLTGTQLLPDALNDRVAYVDDITALRALTAMQEGQVVYLESLNSDYVAVSGSSEEDDGFATIVSSDGTRFYRKGTQNPGYQDASIAFVETLDTGLSPDTPANLRGGLSPDRYEEGGFKQEMEIAVTGVSGSATLSSTDTSKVSGLGGTGFSAVLVSAAGVGSFVTVTGHNGSDEIYLDHPLAEDFSGVLSSKYDSALGQHLTKNATTAYAQHVARATGLAASRKSVLNGTWNALPPSYNTVWGKNQALIDYGVNNSPAPVVQSDILVDSATNLVGSGDRLAHRPLSDACGVRIGCLEAGHGAVASVPLAGKAAVIDFWTGAFRSSTALTGVSMSVVVKGDGRTLYSDTHSHVLRHVTVPVADVDEVTIEATNTDGQIYYMELTQLIVREPGAQGRLIQRGSRVVTLGDSWFAFYDGWFSKMLAKQTGATVINHALGGQTTEWALSWFDEYVAKENPDVCVFHFFTNDSNNLSDDTFTAPDGSELPKWPSGLTDDESLAHWRRNILELAYRCQSIGVKPVFVLPGGTAALAQSTRHAQWRWGIDFGTPNADFPATAGLLADPQSFPNQHGKYTGKPILVGTSYRNAQGAAPGDDWLNSTEAALVPLQKRSLSVSDYSAPNSFTIGTDTDEDGLSDGITEQSYGGSGASGDVFTPSIVSGAQRWESNYSATQSGNTRLAFAADLVAGKEYIAIALISNTEPDAQFDCVSYIGGSATPFSNIRANRYAGSDGTGILYARETAGATGPASINIGSYPEAETVKSVDFERVFFVDLEALFQVAPNAASMSDDELADFCAGMQP